MELFRNRVAIVTGGASGIGQAICTYLASGGATVVLADINARAARAAVAAIRETGGTAHAKTVDVSREDQIATLIRGTVRKHGKIDLLFNNAGMGVNGEFQDIPPELWQKTMDVNFWAVVHGCRHAYPVMLQQGFGQIVNTASLAGLIPGGLLTSYTASKHAVVGFTLSLRAEARLYGIKVNALCPGYIRTNIQKSGIIVTDYLRAEKNIAMEANMKFKTPDQCIGQIMRGVRRNRPIIVSPAKHKLYWWLNRISPSLIPNMFYKIIRKMKQNALDEQETHS